jgi:hypothetical protein
MHAEIINEFKQKRLCKNGRKTKSLEQFYINLLQTREAYMVPPCVLTTDWYAHGI